MKTNLGFLRYSWFNEDANNHYKRIKISHLGYRGICNPFTAGLTMADFENQKVIEENDMKPMYLRILKQDIDSEELCEEVLRLNQPLWSNEQHKGMLARLGIQSHEITKEEALLILSRPRSPEELYRKLGLKAGSTSLSRSFVQCQRSDLSRAGMFILWHKAFKWGDEKISFRELIHRLESMPRESFEMNKEYVGYQNLENSRRVHMNRTRRLRQLPRYLRPLVSTSYVREDVEQYIRNLWLGEEVDISDYLVEQIRAECGWIRDTSEEFFQDYDPVMLHRFINSITTRKSRIKLLSRGVYYNADPIRTMFPNNTCADTICRIAGSEAGAELIQQTERYVRMVAARISRWSDLLSFAGGDHDFEMLCWDDIKAMSEGLPDQAIDHCQTRQQRLCTYVLECIGTGGEMNCRKIFELGTRTRLPVVIEADRQDGIMRYYTERMGNTVITRTVNREIADYNCEGKEVSEILSKYTQFRSAKYSTIPMDTMFTPNRISSHYGRISLSNGDITVTPLSGTPGDSNSTGRPIVDGDNLFEEEDIQIINEYFSNDEFTNDSLELLMRSDRMIPKLIRSVIYYSMNEVKLKKLRSTLHDQRDSAMPPKRRDDVIAELSGLQASDILQFVCADPDDEEGELGSDDGLFDDYLDLWGSEAQDMVPGMELDECADKQTLDIVRSISSVKSNLQKAIDVRNRNGSVIFFSAQLTMYDRMCDENREW